MCTRHQEFLEKHWRICSKLLRRSKFGCQKYSKALLHFGVDVVSDDISIHPEYFCNTCRLTVKRMNNSAGKTTTRVPTEWLPHNDVFCNVCDVQSKGGRPKKIHGGGCPSLVKQHITSVALMVPHFILSQVIDGTIKMHVACSLCKLAANKPVQILHCRSLVCYECCVELVMKNALQFVCPGCSSQHESSCVTFTHLSPLETKMIHDLILRCEKCERTVELKCYEECLEHINQTASKSSTTMTLHEVINQPMEVQPSKLESRATMKVVSRLFHRSNSSTCNLSTGGRVCV